MPGPTPKDPSIRQRRNKSSSRAMLSEIPQHRIPIPELPKGQKWHPMAMMFWESVWESPMSAEFQHGDEPALIRLAYLINKFWNSKKKSLELAKEIRLMEREFGLTPLSRRRLEWTVAQTEEAKDLHEINRAKRAKKMINGKFNDPREVLEQ